MPTHKWTIYAITGPSGVGKTTYCKALAKHLPETVRSSVVFTTRKKRPHECEGEQYYFVSSAEFDVLIQKDTFACHTTFCGNKYGIEGAFIENIIEKEWKDLIFDTIMGIAQLRKINPNTIIIFLSADPKELIQRIIARDPSISQAELKLRKKDMMKQLKDASKCDYIVDTSATRSQKQVLKELIDIIEWNR